MCFCLIWLKVCQLKSYCQISRYLGSYAAPFLQPTTFRNLMVGACNPLEVYESSHVYSVNSRRSHQAPKMQRTRQKKTMHIVSNSFVKIRIWKNNNLLEWNYSWWTLTTLNLIGRYVVGICQLQDNICFTLFLEQMQIQLPRPGMPSLGIELIGCLNSIAKAWNAKSWNWIGQGLVIGNIGHHLIVAIIDHIPNGWVVFNGDI